MEGLRAFFADVGFAGAKTLLQSGNVVFSGPKRSTSSLELLLEGEAKARMSLDTAFFVRTEKEWMEIIEANPFRREAVDDPARLILLALKQIVQPAKVETLQAAIKGREVVRAAGREAYVVYPDGMGRSRLTVSLLEKHLGRCTARNWNTVLRIAAATKT